MFRKIATRTMGGNTQDGTYITFRNVDFGSTPATGLDLMVSSTAANPGNPTGTVQVHPGGLYSPASGSGQILAASWGTQSIVLDEPLSGTHDIVLTFTTAPGVSAVANIDWIQFTSGTGTARRAHVIGSAASLSGASVQYDIAGRQIRGGAALGVRVMRSLDGARLVNLLP
jgi:hypothetical protein